MIERGKMQNSQRMSNFLCVWNAKNPVAYVFPVSSPSTIFFIRLQRKAAPISHIPALLTLHLDVGASGSMAASPTPSTMHVQHI